MNLLIFAEADLRATGSGAERVLANHVAGLAARGHRVTVLSGGTGAASVDGSVAVARLGWSPLTPWRARIEADRIAACSAVDAVLVHHALPAWRALASPRLSGVPSLYVVLSSWPEEYLVRQPRAARPRRALGLRLRRAIEGRVIRDASRVLPMSTFMAERVRAVHGVPAARVRIVPGGVDCARFRPRPAADSRRSFGFSDHGPVILTVRNLEPRMGLEVLLDAMPGVRRRHPGATLVIAGAGPLRATLEARATRLGLEGAARFTGFVPEARLADLYAAADVFVLPTQALEGFGLVTLEALACGIPVLGTPVGATPELLRDLDPGLILGGASREAIEAGILGFLARDDRGELGRRCRERAGRFEWHAVLDALEHEIGEVTACVGTGGRR